MRDYIKQQLREALTRDEQQNLDSLLDKISARGMDSLSPLERKILDKLSQGDDQKESNNFIQAVEQGLQTLQNALAVVVPENTTNAQNEKVVAFMVGPQSPMAHLTQDKILLVNITLYQWLLKQLEWQKPEKLIPHIFHEWARREFQIELMGVLPMTL